MDYQFITQFIGQVGAPVAICFYVLFQLKKSVDANTQAITLLAAKFNVTMPDQTTPGNAPQATKNPFAEAQK